MIDHRVDVPIQTTEESQARAVASSAAGALHAVESWSGRERVKQPSRIRIGLLLRLAAIERSRSAGGGGRA